MFVLAVLVYPGVLALLCVGAGLLVDRASGAFLPATLIPVVGAALLIAVSQLTTNAAATAPTTPYVLAVVAAAGFALGWPKLRMLARAWRTWGWQLGVLVLAFVIALAPVLLAGRPTFSSYLTLTDSAVHMAGADYLIRHGQDYAHLDLHGSYGEYINAYFNAGYPSGAHTLFGGSALLLRVPLIWAFQPFNAFMLATAAGPSWLLLRRLGLDRGWAAVGALAATVPALVYGYELVGSVKEITALPMILALGALAADHPRWLRTGPAAALPFALLVAGGVSALGVGFGVWALAAVAVLVVVAIAELAAGARHVGGVLLLVGVGVAVVVVAAAPTWINASGSLSVARGIAATSNPGNLKSPLQLMQVFGTWLAGSYVQPPVGDELTLTHALIGVTLLAAVLGAIHLIRVRAYALAGWLALMVGLWLALTAYGTTWVDAKVLMLSSPVVVLMAWGGVAAVRASPLRLAAPALAVLLVGGVLVSDVWQYRSSNLAPTARYQEMALLNTRFAHLGPTLFTDFDEYSLYVLRDLDVSGPDFIYTPAALRSVSPHHGSLVILDRIPPAVLSRYPLIVMRRDPTAPRPPSAYGLLWQGTYYQVWQRRPGVAAAILHVGFPASTRTGCAAIAPLAQVAAAHRGRLVAARPADVVRIDVGAAEHPASWTRSDQAAVGLTMTRPGRLRAAFALPRGGVWDLWLQGEIMRTVRVAVDGRPATSISGEVSGKKYIPDTMAPLAVALSAGRHRVTITLGSAGLAPGSEGSAVLEDIFLTPSGPDAQQTLRSASAAGWRSLCGQRWHWIEVVRG